MAGVVPRKEPIGLESSKSHDDDDNDNNNKIVDNNIVSIQQSLCNNTSIMVADNSNMIQSTPVYHLYFEYLKATTRPHNNMVTEEGMQINLVCDSAKLPAINLATSKEEFHKAMNLIRICNRRDFGEEDVDHDEDDDDDDEDDLHEIIRNKNGHCRSRDNNTRSSCGRKKRDISPPPCRWQSDPIKPSSSTITTLAKTNALNPVPAAAAAPAFAVPADDSTVDSTSICSTSTSSSSQRPSCPQRKRSNDIDMDALISGSKWRSAAMLKQRKALSMGSLSSAPARPQRKMSNDLDIIEMGAKFRPSCSRRTTHNKERNESPATTEDDTAPTGIIMSRRRSTNSRPACPQRKNSEDSIFEDINRIVQMNRINNKDLNAGVVAGTNGSIANIPIQVVASDKSTLPQCPRRRGSNEYVSIDNLPIMSSDDDDDDVITVSTDDEIFCGTKVRSSNNGSVTKYDDSTASLSSSSLPGLSSREQRRRQPVDTLVTAINLDNNKISSTQKRKKERKFEQAVLMAMEPSLVLPGKPNW